MSTRFDLTTLIKALQRVAKPAVVVVCALLGAISVNNVVEAKYLAEAEVAPMPRVATSPASKTPQRNRVKEALALADRNMFCSDCVAPVEVGPAIASNGEIPITSLPLSLVATNISEDEKGSFASIINSESGAKGSFWSGNSVPGGGPIERIRPRYVDFMNKQTNRVERIMLLTVARTESKQATRTASYRGRPKSDLEARLDAGIKRISDTQYEVDRALVEEFRKSPTRLKGVRAQPYARNGKPLGVKLYSVRPSSPVGKLGMKNGDLITKVNGFDMTTPDKMLAAYTKLQGANRFSVTVERRGKPVELRYQVR